MKVLKKWWFWVIIVVVIGGIGSAVAGSKNSSNSTKSDNSVNSSSILSDNSVDDSAKSDPELDSIYGMGETAKAKSFNLTANSVNVVESNNQFVQPDEGNEYVEVEFVLENTSDSDIVVSSVLNCNAYVDGFAVSENLSAGVAAGSDSFNGTVASGKKLKGCLFYELSNEWNELEIDISIGLSKEDEVKFLFTK